MENLFRDLPVDLPAELTEILVENSQVRIERIVSTGQCSDPGFWYEQKEDEWVCVLRGEAKIEFEADGSGVHMKPGDHLLIPSGQRHRVDWTSDNETTVWLAVFFNNSP